MHIDVTIYMYGSPNSLHKVQFISVENWLRNYPTNQYPKRISEITKPNLYKYLSNICFDLIIH